MNKVKVARKTGNVNGKNINRRVRKKIKLVEKEEKEEAEDTAEEDEDLEVNRTVEVESEEENQNTSEAEEENGLKDEVFNGNTSDPDSNESSEESSEESNDSAPAEPVENKKKKAPRRKRKQPTYNAAEEARLERLVFGDPSDVINKLLQREEPVNNNDEYEAINSQDLPNFPQYSDDSSSDSNYELDDEDSNLESKRTSAWVDDDDMQYSVDAALNAQHRKLPRGRPEKVYTELLENKFTQLVGTPKWASLDPSTRNDSDSDDEILKHSNHLVVEKVKKLRRGKIDIKALTDINKSTRTEGPIVTTVEFHPTSTVAMVAGLSGILSLFQVDGRENNKLHSIQFDKFRINRARFLKEGTEVVVGSRHHAHCHGYDLITGKTSRIPLPHGITNMQNFEVSPDGKLIAIAGRMGQIHLLSAATKELVGNLKMNKKCSSLAFSPDSKQLISHGDSEEIYIWDIQNRSCMHKLVDDGCIAGTSIAFSPSGQFIATGSKQGVVNIYDTKSVLQARAPIPLKIIMNLTTSITAVKFNPSSEILAIASNIKENAFKMVHIPSFTVFDNFPTFQTKLHYPLDIDFSPNSGYLGLSNNMGHAHLFRLKHFGNY